MIYSGTEFVVFLACILCMLFLHVSCYNFCIDCDFDYISRKKKLLRACVDMLHV